MNIKTCTAIGAILAGLSFTSCKDFLNVEKDIKDRMTIEEVFTKEDYTEQWLANAYSYLPNDVADVSSEGNWPFCYSDDMYNPLYKALTEVSYGEESSKMSTCAKTSPWRSGKTTRHRPGSSAHSIIGS